MKLIMAFILPLLFSCSYTKQEAENNFSPNDSLAKSDRTLNEPEEVVLKFYEWYLKDIYLKKYFEAPEVKLTTDSIYQLDATEHIKFITESKYFSSKFYENEIPMFKSCDEQLKRVDVKKVIASGSFPGDFVEGNECAFLNFMIWTGGQGESLTSVDIVKSNLSNDSATVSAVISDDSGYKYSYPLVTLLKENNLWKIINISVSYDAPK